MFEEKNCPLHGCDTTATHWRTLLRSVLHRYTVSKSSKVSWINVTLMEQIVSYEFREETRTRITRPMSSFLNGRKSLKALAEAMDDFNQQTVGRGAVNITSADMPRACGTFGDEISEIKMTAIVKYLERNTTDQKEPFSDKDICKESKFFRFTDGLNYVIATREYQLKSRSEFAKEIGASEKEVKDAETGHLVRYDLFEAYKKEIEKYGVKLKLKN